MKKEAKTIFFDVGGVLQIGNSEAIKRKENHFTKGVHEYVTSKLKLNLDQYFDALEEIYPKAVDGTLSEEEALNKMSLNLRVPKTKIKKIYLKAYKKNFRLNRPLLKKAIKLKKLGYKTAILSDMWYISKQSLIPKKLSDKFTDSIVSCDVKTRKPRPEIYKIALKRLKTKPAEALFIDNQLWNTQAATKLGIKTIQFKDNKQLFKTPVWTALFK